MVEQLLGSFCKSREFQLVAFIIDWRRSELACWQTLLDAQSTAFLDELFDWCQFRLYDALVRGALSASQEGTWSNGEHCYLHTLIPLLDDFTRAVQWVNFMLGCKC